MCIECIRTNFNALAISCSFGFALEFQNHVLDEMLPCGLKFYFWWENATHKSLNEMSFVRTQKGKKRNCKVSVNIKLVHPHTHRRSSWNGEKKSWISTTKYRPSAKCIFGVLNRQAPEATTMKLSRLRIITQAHIHTIASVQLSRDGNEEKRKSFA